MTITVEEAIDQVISLYKVQEEFYATKSSERIEELKPIFHRKVAEVKALQTPEVLLAVVMHYEKRLAKLEAESLRMVIMREMVRDVIREESKK